MATIELRPARTDDFEELCALHNRAMVFDGEPRVLDVEEIHADLDDEQVVLATDTRVVLVDGAVAGYGYTIHLPSEELHERCYLVGQIDPAFRGQGAGRALMAWQVERGREQLLSSGNELPKKLRVEHYDYLEPVHRFVQRFGFAPVRYFEELLRPLEDLPALPDIAGLRIVPWPEDRDEEIRLVKNRAFADHWGSTPTSVEYWQQMVRGVGARADLSFVALDDSGAVVAHCLNHRYPQDDELLGRSDGWIDSLGTLPEWRGKGVASALIAHSLHAFTAAGLTHASINVDSDSPTGAARLYRAIGFERQQLSLTFELVVSSSEA